MNEEFTEYRNGWYAHSKGAKYEDNPYNQITQQVSYSLWGEGWSGRYNARKHGLDMSLDEELGIS